MTDAQQDQDPLGTAAAQQSPSARETVNRMIARLASSMT